MTCGFQWGEDNEHDDTNHECILNKDHSEREHECYCGEAVEDLENPDG